MSCDVGEVTESLEKQTDRNRQTETDRQKQTDRHRQIDRDRQTDRRTDTHTHTHRSMHALARFINLSFCKNAFSYLNSSSGS